MAYYHTPESEGMVNNTEEEEPNWEQINAELKRELSPAEREFLQTELEHSMAHHDNMARIVDSMPELHQKPVLFINATEFGITGNKWFNELHPELLDMFMQIQTGQHYDKDKFDYRQFPDMTFRHMFGFGPDDTRFQSIRTVEPNAKVPETTKGDSLVIGSGGELNQRNTQKQYLEQQAKIKQILKQVLRDETPFVLVCATHQAMGQCAHELAGQDDLIIDEFKDKEGKLISEDGVIDMFLTPEAKNNRFTKLLPDQFSIMSSHGQYLTQVPEDAVSLANNHFNNVSVNTQVLGYENGFGVQGHPEISSAVLLLQRRFQNAEMAAKKQTILDNPEIDQRPTWVVREQTFPEALHLAHERHQLSE